MELSIMLAQQIFSMLLMILVGYFSGKSGILDQKSGKRFSTLALYILCPCLVFNSCQMEFTMDRLAGFMICTVAAIVVHIIFIPLSHLLAKIYPMDDLDRVSLIYSNAGNLIVPLVSALLGGEFVFYASSYLVVQTILFWTHARKLITGRKGSIRDIISNPNILAAVVGLIFFFFQIPLPGIISDTISKIGGCIGPISMITIGIIMSSLSLKKIFTDVHTYVVTLLRLFIMPTVFVLVLWITGITKAWPIAGTALIATVLGCSGPTAVSISQVARLTNKESSVRSGMVNIMSTLFCIIAMPLTLMLYQVLCT